MTAHACQTCEREFGADKFDRELLRNRKHHQRKKLECKQCAADAKEKVRELQKRMQKSKRRCKCYCSIHKPLCPLTVVILGERRWPGSDLSSDRKTPWISAEDRKFLDGLNPRPPWWSKAWGRLPDK